MISFVKNPNLPQGKISTVICGTDDEKILSFFKSNSIDVIKTQANPNIDKAISTHADILAIHIGKRTVLVEENQLILKNELVKLGMTVYETDDEIKGNYPADVKLNFALVGENLLGNFKYADSRLLNLLSDKTKVQVNQGYCKCSVLVVRNNAIITDDVSVSQKALKNGLNCLLIEKGDISLPGHEYGFIGGASGKISENTVVFFGNIENHSDFENIKAFLQKHGCNYVCSDDGKLRDIGGIIPLTEK